jgi:hypothetical protein
LQIYFDNQPSHLYIDSMKNESNQLANVAQAASKIKLAVFNCDSRGMFIVHAAGCADCEREKDHGHKLGFTIEEHDSQLSVSRSIWSDMIDERSMTAEDGLAEIEFKPCVKFPTPSPASRAAQDCPLCQGKGTTTAHGSLCSCVRSASKTFRVLQVSKNVNSFGLSGVVLLARDGEAFEAATYTLSPSFELADGADIKLLVAFPDRTGTDRYSWIAAEPFGRSFEIPRALPLCPAAALAKIFPPEVVQCHNPAAASYISPDVVLRSPIRAATFMGIRPGDRVTFQVPAGRGRNGQEYGNKSGRATLVFADHVVCNCGGAHGTPGVCDSNNYVSHKPASR